MSRHQRFSLEEESEITYTMLELTQCMNSKGQSTCCIIISDRACTSTELAGLIYDKSKEESGS